MNVNDEFEQEAWMKRQFDPPSCDCKVLKSTLYRALIKVTDKREEDLNCMIDEEPEKVEGLNSANEFGTYWTVHGPVHMIKSKHWFSRVIWLIIWLLMLFYGSWISYSIINSYLQYPTKVEISIQDVDKLQFPAVTICSLAVLSPKDHSFFTNSKLWSSYLAITQEYMTSKVNGCESLNSHQIVLESIADIDHHKYSCLDMDPGNMTAIDIDECFETIDADTERAFRDPINVNQELYTGESLKSQHFLVNKMLESEQSSDEVSFVRIHCSLIYQISVYKGRVSHGERGEVDYKLGDFSQCPADIANDYENNFHTVYDIICKIVIYIDLFGGFDSYGYDCDPARKKEFGGKEYICSSCCLYKTSCILAEELNQRQYIHFESADYIELLLNNIELSPTIDGYNLVDSLFVSRDHIEDGSHNIKEVITSCSYDGQGCSHWDFEEWLNYRYGKCYTFNASVRKQGNNLTSNNVKFTRSPGIDNGLSISFNIYSKAIIDLITPELGARVIIHDPQNIPFPEDEGIVIPPGNSNSIRVSMKKISREVPPWGNCGERTLNSSFAYSQILCSKLCLQAGIREQCSCYQGLSPAYDDLHGNNNKLRRCSPVNSLDSVCVDLVIFKFYHKLLDCDCPPSCNEWEYIARFSTATTQKNYYKILQNIKNYKLAEDTCTDNESQDETVRLHVYLENLSYESIREIKSFTFEKLVSNLGGTFGLFIGLSILSLVEFLEFFYDLIIFYLRKIFGRKQSTEEKKQVYIAVDYFTKSDSPFGMDHSPAIHRKKSEAFETIFEMN